MDYDRTDDDSEPLGLTRLEANPFCPDYLGAACEPLPNLFDTESGLDPANGTRADGYSLTLRWDLSSAWRFKSITARRSSDTDNNIDFDTTPARIVDAYVAYFDQQTTQEIQLAFDRGGRWHGVLGCFYFNGEAGGSVRNVFFENTFVSNEGDTATESFAVYADASYRFSDRLTFHLGLRPTRETKRGRAFNAVHTDDSFTEVLFVTADYDDSVRFSSLAPRLGLDYRFSPEVMGYATVSRGFKSGGFNVRAQSIAFPDSALPFDDEVLTMAELGVKSTLAGGRLVLNTAAFYGDYRDIQVSTFTSFDADGDGEDDSFFGDFLNAGDATIQGVELEVDWSSAAGLGLSGFAAYLDASPDSFLDQNRDGFVDTQVITNAPELTGAIRADATFPAFGGWMTGSVGLSYRGEAVLTNEGGPDPGDPTRPLLPLVQPSITLLDAWVSWLSPKAAWRIGLSAKNLTGEEVLKSGYNLAVLGAKLGSYGAPRRVVATLEYRF